MTLQFRWPGPRALYVVRRNAIVWRHGAMWSSILGDLFEPIIYLFGLGYGLGYFVEDVHGESFVGYIAPGLLAMGAMWSASFENTYSAMTRMDKQKTYDAIMVTPVNIEEVVAGDIIWAATKSAIGGTMMLLVVSVMGLATYPLALLCIPQAFLTGLAFGAISITVTAVARTYDFFTYYFTIVLTPLLLLSEAWYPLDGFPPLLQAAANLSPLTHAVRPMRVFMGGRFTPQAVVSLGALVVFSVAFSILAMVLIRRRLVR